MATKTITLELDAYEKLRRMKRGKESFSAVVRRARFDEEQGTGAQVLKEFRALYGKAKAPGGKRALDYLAQLQQEKSEQVRISPSPWDK